MELKKSMAIPLAVLAVGPIFLVNPGTHVDAKTTTVKVNDTKLKAVNTKRDKANAKLVATKVSAAKEREKKVLAQANHSRYALLLHKYQLADEQDVLYRFTPVKGQYHAVYDRPGTLQGAKVLKTADEVNKLAHEYTFDNYLYATQTAETSRHSDYLYVKSFDGKVNGWIYAKGLRQIATSHVVDSSKAKFKNDADVYLDNVGKASLYKAPLGTQKTPQIATGNLYNYVSDSFKVLQTKQAYRTGEISVLVQDKNNASVKGWIKQDNLSLSRDETQLKDFDSANMVKVKFVDAYNSDKVITTSNLPTGVNGVGKDVSAILKGTDKLGSNAWANAQLSSYGYQYDPSLSYNQQALNNAHNGDTVSVAVVNTKKVTSSFNITAVDANGNLVSTPVSLQSDGVLGSDVVNLNRDYTQALQNVLTGRLGSTIPWSSVLSNISSSPVTGEIVGTQNYVTDSNGKEVYVGTNDLPSNAYHYIYRVNTAKTLAANTGLTYGQPASLIYDRIKVNSPIVPTTATIGTTPVNTAVVPVNSSNTNNVSYSKTTTTKLPDNMIVYGNNVGTDGTGTGYTTTSNSNYSTSSTNGQSAQDAYNQGYTDATNNANGVY